MLVLAAAGIAGLMAWRGRAARAAASPSCASLAPWAFYGGEWNTQNGVLEAARNGRGDMAVSRRSDYTNFHLSIQMQVRDLYPNTNYGDAGLLFRVRNAHLGVDSYDGYYAGLRASDHTLIFGRIDQEWQQLAFKPLAAPVMADAWYRLQVTAQGCDFTVAASAAGGAPTRLRYTDPHCPRQGSIGVRVYYVKASWRDLDLRPE